MQVALRFLAVLLVTAIIAFTLAPARLAAKELEGQVIILTSFPDTIFASYREAFEAKHPKLSVHVLNKKTSAAISYIQDQSSEQVDIVWASAPDAFEVLKETGHLRRLDLKQPGKIVKVAGYPLNDPQGFYTGFAVSGYGLMWNKDYLARHNLPSPKNWDDLADSSFSGHVAITSPSRSGTTHLVVETILQSKGWEDGWALLVEMSGNLATVTARSFGVRDGIRAGRFGVGPVIDFFGLSSMATGWPVDFAYPLETVLLPANIGIVKNARNVTAAAAFIDFVTSAEGQRILLKPEISRLPVKSEVYNQAPKNFPNPFNGSIRTKGLIFDSDLSRKRYHLVNSLFDELITFRLKTLKAAWKAIREAERELGSGSNEAMTNRLKRARGLLTHVPVSAAQSHDPAFTGRFSRKKPGFPVSSHQDKEEQKWIENARQRYREAQDIAESVLSALKLKQSAGQPL